MIIRSWSGTYIADNEGVMMLMTVLFLHGYEMERGCPVFGAEGPSDAEGFFRDYASLVATSFPRTPSVHFSRIADVPHESGFLHTVHMYRDMVENHVDLTT